MKFIHSADFHLCAGLNRSLLPTEVAEAHRRQLFKTFTSVSDACRSEKADIWLIAGDLFESAYVSASDIRRISEVFESVGDTRVFISCGNHDPLTPDSYYNTVKMPQNVTVFPPRLTRVTLDELNTAVYGFSWNKNRYQDIPFEFTAPDKSLLNILCLHCDATGKSHYMSINPAQIAAVGFDYAALGHIHKCSDLKNGIIYSGSPEPLDFGESGKHGFILGEYNGEELNVKFRRTAARSFITCEADLSELNSHSAITQSILNRLGGNKNDIIRLTFKGTLGSDIDLNAISEELKERFYCLLTYDETTPGYDLELIMRENKNNIIGKFIASLKDRAESDETAAEALNIGLKALLENVTEAKK